MIDLLEFRLIDLLDILLLAFLLYQLYRLLKGTVAINIMVGVGAIVVIWRFLEFLNMDLVGSFLGAFIEVGVIALIVVFQQEVRKFLLYVGTTDLGRRKGLPAWLGWNSKAPQDEVDFELIAEACRSFSQTKTGAILVVGRKTGLGSFESTGEALEAKLSIRMLESIFQKESPLHDGAVVISGDRIRCARCILPVSDEQSLPSRMGMRHRAGLGLAERTDALVAIVSEQTGDISLACDGQLESRLSPEELQDRMRSLYTS